MIDWSCLDCDWWDSFEAADDPKHYCPECGGITEPRPTIESLADAETLTAATATLSMLLWFGIGIFRSSDETDND